MCRVAVRNTPRARPVEEVQNADEGLLYEQLQGMMDIKPEGDFNELFPGADDVDIDADLNFLEMFAAQGHPGGVAEAQIDAVLGQPVESTPYQAVVQAVAPVMQPQQQIEQQQQQQMAAMQFQTGLMQTAPTGFAPPAAALQQQYTQVILQQHLMAQMQAGANGASMAVNKRGKTAAEIAEQQERIKRRRRESAQRSRQRKSTYMKTLECENQALKVENDRLRRELARLGRPMPPMFNSSTTSGSSAGQETKPGDDTSEPYTGTSSDGGLCPVDLVSTQDLMGMALHLS